MKRKMETLKLCGVFMVGWIAAHQWMLHQEPPSSNNLTNHIHQFRTISRENTNQHDIDVLQDHEQPQYTVTTHTYSDINAINKNEHASSIVVKADKDHDTPPPLTITANFPHQVKTKGLKPSWHRLIDCSIYALSECFIAPLEYEEYPTFDTLPPIRSNSPRAHGHHTHSLYSNLSRIMTARLQNSERLDGKPLERTPPKPPGFSCDPKAAQASKSMDDVYNDELSQLGRDAKELGVVAAFTMADQAYATQVKEVGHMARRHGLKVLLFACMDVETLAAACEESTESDRFRGALIPGLSDNANKKNRVEHGKFWTAQRLCELGTDFLFFEMDIWIISPPTPLFALHYNSANNARNRLGLRMHQGRLDNSPAYLSEGIIDLLVSVHQDVPFSMNIGFYSVLGNSRTASFFSRLLALLKEDPTLKDQRLFINLCRHPKSVEDLWGGGVFGLIPPHFVAAHTKPHIMANTIAVHTLSNRPLSNPSGKKMIAKELMVWSGASGYYHEYQVSPHKSVSPEKKRYLALDAHALTMNSNDLNHKPHYLRGILTLLIGIAAATSRILVLPSVFHDSFYFYPWTVLDLKSLDDVGIEWRETNFLRTLRLRTERSSNEEEYTVDNSIFHDVTRLAVAKGGIAIQTSNTAHDVDTTMKSSSSSSSSSPSLQKEPSMSSESPWEWLPMSADKSAVLNEGFWSLLLEDKAIIEPSLLLINFPYLDGISPGSFQRPYGGPPWLEALYNKLRWCNAERKGGMFTPKAASLTISSDDCFGQGKPLGLNA